MRIAVLVPVTSRNRELREVAEADIVRLFLPSFVETASWVQGLEYEIYVGVDDIDPFYGESENQRALLEECRRALRGRPASIACHTFGGTAHAPCRVWNELFTRAYRDGADYFYQMGDDVSLVTPGWTGSFIRALQSNPVLPGLGVTGPLETVAKTILTQAFVSRVHKDVFGTFYPEVFKNWWSDDWITEVYRPEHLFVCRDHLVHNAGGIERYDIDAGAERRLAEEVKMGKERLSAWLLGRGLDGAPRPR